MAKDVKLSPQQQALIAKHKKELAEFKKLEYNAWLVQSAETHRPVGVFKYKSDALKAIKGYLRTLNFILLHGDIINKIGEEQNAKYLDEIKIYREDLSTSEDTDLDFDVDVNQTLLQLHIMISDVFITTSKYRFPVFKDGFKLVHLGSDNKNIVKNSCELYHLKDNVNELSDKERSLNVGEYDENCYSLNLGPLFKVYDRKKSETLSF